MKNYFKGIDVSKGADATVAVVFAVVPPVLLIAALCVISGCGATAPNLPNIRTPYGETSGTEVILYPLPDIEIGNPPAKEY